MQVPSLGASGYTYIRLGVAHEAALAVDPTTQHLAAGIRAATERVRQAVGQRQAARETAVAKMAVRERADFELDQLVRLIDLDALAAAGRDRKASPYRELFPRGVTAVVAAPLADEIQAVRTLEGRLRESPEALRAHAEPLRAARERLEQAVAEHREAARTESEAAGQLLLAKTDWQRQYRASYGALLTIFGDRRRAESFFVRATDTGSEEAEEEPPATPAPATPT